MSAIVYCAGVAAFGLLLWGIVVVILDSIAKVIGYIDNWGRS